MRQKGYITEHVSDIAKFIGIIIIDAILAFHLFRQSFG